MVATVRGTRASRINTAAPRPQDTDTTGALGPVREQHRADSGVTRTCLNPPPAATSG